MSLKAGVDDDSMKIESDLEGVDPESGSGKDQIRIDRRPGFRKPPEIDPRVFQIQKAVGSNHSRLGFPDDIGCSEFGDDIREGSAPRGDKGYILRGEGRIE